MKPWSTLGESLSHGTKRHTVLASSVADGSETRELAEFNFAWAQMQRLMVGRTIQIHQIDVYESPTVERIYEAKRLTKPESNELWVFHGTGDAGIDGIMQGGFKVAGRDPGAPPVRHGAAYGHGVYTATGPKYPMVYANSAGTNAVILAKALEGTRGLQGIDDCWAPRENWLVFKTGEQLLPKYVVHWA